MFAILTRTIATCFALACFVAALIVGYSAGNPASTVVGRALLILIGGYVIALPVGVLVQWAVRDHVARYKRDHPIPQTMDDLEPADDAGRRLTRA